MPKVTLIQVVYNNRKFISPVFSAIFNQTFKDFNVVAVISGNDDGGKELLMQKFPKVEIIDPGYNIGFAKGHNLVFDRYKSEFFQLVNPDMVMEPNYIEEMLKAFADEKVGAATGKLYKVNADIISNFPSYAKASEDKQFPISSQRSNVKGPVVAKAMAGRQMSNVLDTTGVTINKSGRARDRGQHEADNHQYDNLTSVQAVSAAGAMYRRQALIQTQLPKIQDPISKNQTSSIFQIPNSKFEYFDEDFHSYWEDVDLTWRMSNAGWKNVFVPSAVGYHGRGAGSSVGGYKDIIGFIKHHKTLSPQIRRLNYQNHIFMYIKNSPWFYPQFFVREFFMFFYILFFEIGTLKVLPQMFKLLPRMFKKRQIIISSNHA